MSFTTNGNTRCQLDSGPFTDCKSPYRRSRLHGGRHNITITTSDGLQKKSVSFTVPGSCLDYGYTHILLIQWVIACVIVLDPIQLRINPPVVIASIVKISFNSSAPTQCKLDAFSFYPCKSPYQKSNLKSGRHTVTIKATDNIGCVKQNSVTFYIGGMYTCAMVLIYCTCRNGTTTDYTNIR